MRKMGLGWGKLNADRECEGGNRADDGSHRRPPPFPAADERVKKKRNRRGNRGGRGSHGSFLLLHHFGGTYVGLYGGRREWRLEREEIEEKGG